MTNKSQKVLNKLHANSGGLSEHLGKKDNDECYTSMQDIGNELQYWGSLGKFRGKKIICPCDWDIVEGEDIYSITIEYKDTGIELTTNNVFKAVKAVQYDLWGMMDDEGNCEVETITVEESDIEDFLRNKLTCNFIRTFTQCAVEWGIKSITASGYNPEVGKGVPFQDVDFTQYDVCVTNPPFSLYSEFMKAIVDKIDFIILAPFMNRVTPNVGLPLMLGKAYLGTSANTGQGFLSLKFHNPTLENHYNTKAVACDWITSFPESQLERNKKKFRTGISYELYKDDYELMENMTMKDGTHPLKVPTAAIPDDYNGWMFGQINVLAKISFDEFEWYITSASKYFNTEHPECNPFNHKINDDMFIHGCKKCFKGIVFRRKQKEEE